LALGIVDTLELLAIVHLPAKPAKALQQLPKHLPWLPPRTLMNLYQLHKFSAIPIGINGLGECMSNLIEWHGS
jgi:hypothetical protein